MSEIFPHAKTKLEAVVAEGKKKKKTCRTIEDGLGNAFDSNDFMYPRFC